MIEYSNVESRDIVTRCHIYPHLLAAQQMVGSIKNALG